MLSSRVFSLMLLGALVLLGLQAIGPIAAGAVPAVLGYAVGEEAPRAAFAPVEQWAARFDSEALPGAIWPLTARFDAEPLPERTRAMTARFDSETVPSRLRPIQTRFDDESWPNARPTIPRFDGE